MISQSLSGSWNFRQSGTEARFEGKVPGGVHTDLLNLGKIPDPFIGDNEIQVIWVAESNWDYKISFQSPEKLFKEEKLFLVADGLDTLTSVTLNGIQLGETNNQFRQWRWDISNILKESHLVLIIHFKGPSTYVSNQQKKRKLTGVSQTIEVARHLRKAPYQFGWDWGPKLPSIHRVKTQFRYIHFLTLTFRSIL